MDDFSRRLNELLVKTFRDVLKMEEQSLKASGAHSLSISETHLLDAVAERGADGVTISELAAAMDITLPSVTVAVNRLEGKGYVEKARSVDDGRRVYVRLTRQGHKLVQAHRYFHENMVRQMTAGLTDEEKQVMLGGVAKLDAFFDRKTPGD